MRKIFSLLPIFLTAFLAACVNDGTAYDIRGDRQHSISVLREQPFFWDKTVHFFVILSRMPDCTRRHEMADGTPTSVIDVFQVPSGAYILQLGSRYFAAEIETCEGFAEINDLNAQGEPKDGTGLYRGRFHTKDGAWTFTKAQDLQQ